MNYAKNASRLTRGLGNGLTYISIGATTVSTINAVTKTTGQIKSINQGVLIFN